MFTDRELELLFNKVARMLEPLQAQIKELQKNVEDLSNLQKNVEDLSNASQERPKTSTRGRKRVQQAEENAGASH
jgi:conjugal transfer/entry exclusion protein